MTSEHGGAYPQMFTVDDLVFQGGGWRRQAPIRLPGGYEAAIKMDGADI